MSGKVEVAIAAAFDLVIVVAFSYELFLLVVTRNVVVSSIAAKSVRFTTLHQKASLERPRGFAEGRRLGNEVGILTHGDKRGVGNAARGLSAFRLDHQRVPAVAGENFLPAVAIDHPARHIGKHLLLLLLACLRSVNHETLVLRQRPPADYLVLILFLRKACREQVGLSRGLISKLSCVPFF